MDLVILPCLAEIVILVSVVHAWTAVLACYNEMMQLRAGLVVVSLFAEIVGAE
jgi:hypothetical protein